MMKFITDVRNAYGDLLRNQALKMRRRTWISRERELRQLSQPRERALHFLQKSYFWKSGDMNLSWADLFDSLARRISGQGDHPATPILRKLLDQQAARDED